MSVLLKRVSLENHEKYCSVDLETTHDSLNERERESSLLFRENIVLFALTEVLKHSNVIENRFLILIRKFEIQLSLDYSDSDYSNSRIPGSSNSFSEQNYIFMAFNTPFMSVGSIFNVLRSNHRSPNYIRTSGDSGL